MLVRAWLFLGMISAALAMGAFFYVLLRAGWSPGDSVSAGSPLHEAYTKATTMTFLAIVVCQIGTALAARTERASLRSVGLFTNPLLLWGFLFELVFAAALVYLPPLQAAFSTAALGPASSSSSSPSRSSSGEPTSCAAYSCANTYRTSRRTAARPIRTFPRALCGRARMAVGIPALTLVP